MKLGGILLLGVITFIGLIFPWPAHRAEIAAKGRPTPSIDRFPGPKVRGDQSRYPATDYDAPLPTDKVEREKRVQKSKRYDGWDWVVSHPAPETSGAGATDETPPPSAVPVDESDAIIVGRVSNAHAHLSNNKRGVYTEFEIVVDEVLKSGKRKIRSGETSTVDRPGGIVRYPNGQTLFYVYGAIGFPQVGTTVVLFLTTDGQSPNYQVLTGYELNDAGAWALDYLGPDLGLSASQLLQIIRDKVKAP
jgi:hypothetical protein